MVEQGVQGRAYRAARIEDIIHENDVPAGDRERDFGGVHNWLGCDGGQIIAIEADVQNADRDVDSFERLDLGGEALGHGHAAAADADEGQPVQVLGFLQDFVRQTDQRTVNFRGAHQLRLLPCGKHRRSERQD
jgi:hypothetical protein